MSIICESLLEKKVPFLKWYQNKDYVIFDIYNQILERDIKIEKNKFSIQNQFYEMNFDFFDEINEETVQIKKDSLKLRVYLEKVGNKNYFWTYLSKDNNYRNQIQVNWDKWVDENDENEESEMESNHEQIDFEQMMSSMGGGMNLENMNNEINDVENDDVENDDVENDDVEK